MCFIKNLCVCYKEVMRPYDIITYGSLFQEANTATLLTQSGGYLLIVLNSLKIGIYF